MSRSSSKSGSAKRTKVHHDVRYESSGDGAVYLGLLMIGALSVPLAALLIDDMHLAHGVVGFIIAITVLINWYALGACRGVKQARWQRALARLPLRFAGYGTRDGKPLEAAHGSDKARIALFISISLGILIIVAASVLLIPTPT